MARVWRSDSVAATEALGRRLAEELRPDGVLLLSGDLGAGKTALTRGVAAALGVDPREVQSPTFVLIREHRGSGGALIHADLYRLEPSQVASTGLDELLAGPGVKVIEWAERLPAELLPAGPVVRLELTRAPGGEGGERPVDDGQGVREVRELPGDWPPSQGTVSGH